jgi:hypothetical protein
MPDAQTITRLLKLMHVSKVKVLRYKSVVECSCPLAEWKHGGGHDNNPSFGIKIAKKGPCNCKSCGWHGNLVDLVLEFRTRHGNRAVPNDEAMLALVKEIAHETPDLEAIKKKGKRATFDYEPPREVAGIVVQGGSLSPAQAQTLDTDGDPLIDEAWLHTLPAPPPEIMVWLIQRGLTDATIRQWELCWQPFAKRLVIPIRDFKGRLVGLSGRATNGAKPKFKHSQGFQKNHYLYGEHLIPQRGVDTGYVVEGFFDVMYLHQHGYPAVAVMGSSTGELQRLKLVRFMRNVVIVPDGDKPGYAAGNRLMQELGTTVPTRLVAMPEGRDPDQLAEAELRALLLS